jgi:lysophospholipase L1-like esterase
MAGRVARMYNRSKTMNSARFATFAGSMSIGVLLSVLACSDDTTGGAAMNGGSSGQGQAGAVGGVGGSGAGTSGAGAVTGGAGAGGAGAGSGGAGGGGAGGASAGGGAAGSAGQGGTGGQAPYNPCPTNGDPCRVMPLGDSITDGGGQEGGAYRVELFRLAVQNQKKLVFVGSHESGPAMVEGVPFPRHQEGHSGWTIADGGGRDGLYDMIQGWLAATPPDIVTLMIGTNDCDIPYDVDTAPMRLGLLLDRIAENAPHALTVVAQIVPTKQEKDTDDSNVKGYNAAIPALVKERTDKGQHIVSVDMYGAFTKVADYENALMNDNLHPKQEGLVVMAKTWWDAIGPLLPAQ